MKTLPKAMFLDILRISSGSNVSCLPCFVKLDTDLQTVHQRPQSCSAEPSLAREFHFNPIREDGEDILRCLRLHVLFMRHVCAFNADVNLQ
jgi:hypothetical protein